MKASEEQSERLHRFAHDLRNRLIGMQQALEHLRASPTEDERNEFALFAEQQYFKALREVESVLDDLHVQRGSLRPTLVSMPIATIVKQALDLLQYRFQRKGQIVRADLPESLLVHADERIAVDIVEALLSNASKFSPAGSTIELRASEQGGAVALSVQDHGTGLGHEDVENVFTRFAWLQNRPTAGESQGRGTLARAREWAIEHGGTLVAASAGQGHGCTFTLRLPLAP